MIFCATLIMFHCLHMTKTPEVEIASTNPVVKSISICHKMEIDVKL